MNSSECSQLLLAPQTEVCSGHGTCSNETGVPRCQCFPPWTSRGDFRYELGLDCDVFPPAIVGMYSLSLAGFLAVGVLCIRNLFMLLRNRDQQSKTVDKVAWFSGPVLVHQLVLYTVICHSAFDILKIADPVYYSIGFEPVSTWIMGFANVFLFLFGAFMTNGLLKVSLKQSEFTGRESTRALLFLLKAFTPFILVGLSTFHILSTVGGYYAPQHGEVFLFVAVIGSNILFVLYAFFVPTALGHILKDMANLMNHAKNSNSVVSPTLVRIHAKLNTLRINFFVQPIQNGIVNFVIALWPFLLRKYCYIFAVFQCFMPGILIISLLSFRKTAATQDAEKQDAEAAHGDLMVLSSVTELIQRADVAKNGAAVLAVSNETDSKAHQLNDQHVPAEDAKV